MIAFLTAAALSAIPVAALPTNAEAASRPQADTPAPAAKSRKPIQYCIENNMTGTRIPLRECRTRTEWLSLGFDPLEKRN